MLVLISIIYYLQDAFWIQIQNRSLQYLQCALKNFNIFMSRIVVLLKCIKQ